MANWTLLAGYPRELGGHTKYVGSRGRHIGEKVVVLKGLDALADLFERLLFEAAAKRSGSEDGDDATAHALDGALEAPLGYARLRHYIDVIHFVRVRGSEIDLAFAATQLRGIGRVHMDVAGPIGKFIGKPLPAGSPNITPPGKAGPSLAQRFEWAEAGTLAPLQALSASALDQRDGFGRTLLTVACQNDHAAVVEWLLDAGASPTAHAHEALFLRYLPEETRDVSRGENHTLLHVAAWSHSLSVVDLLLLRGFDVDARDPYGATSLIDAAMRDSDGADATIERLLAAGADVGAHDAAGKTALDHAGKDGTLRLLLDAGASPDGGPVLGRVHPKELSVPPLERFALAGNRSAIELLLARGADVQRAPHALAFAVSAGSIEAREALLARNHLRTSLDEALLEA